MAQYDTMITAATAAFRVAHPRATYGLAVLAGRQRWSGSDLRGNAAAFRWVYARARRRAQAALEAAGGVILATAPRGELAAMVRIGTDDYGNALYQGRAGTYRPAATGSRMELL
jgi:hypothetical protein